MTTTIIDQKIFKIKKNLFSELYNKYLTTKKEYENDLYNYNKIIKHKKEKQYIKQLLETEKINRYYFFHNSKFMPTVDEFNDISAMMAKLWQLDSNKFIINRDVRLNIQGKTNKYNTVDESPYPLFDYANLEKFKTPTYKYFLKISKYFSREIGISEADTEFKHAQIMKFINTMCNTRIFLYLFYFLLEKKVIDNFLDFPNYMYKLWFGQISKKSQNDSSAFEHVFIGEMSDQKILGFHNWIQFYMEENIGRINYYGHTNDIVGDFPYIMEITFSWENRIKNTSTMFIAVSPEFEFALYTICYHLTSADNNAVEFKINGDNIKIIVIRRNDALITSYPLINK